MHTKARLLTIIIQVTMAGSIQAQHSPIQSFTGKAGKTLAETTPGNTPFNPVAAKNAPNIVYILLDDVGFGASSAFGGLIETPVFDSLPTTGSGTRIFIRPPSARLPAPLC